VRIRTRLPRGGNYSRSRRADGEAETSVKRLWSRSLDVADGDIRAELVKR
jgi:hypothetical protein